uniref:Transmembrane protein 14A n=1 Tax=Suricata suricatta TaxID=37032 RepID=A0A673UA56_SURSU
KIQLPKEVAVELTRLLCSAPRACARHTQRGREGPGACAVQGRRRLEPAARADLGKVACKVVRHWQRGLLPDTRSHHSWWPPPRASCCSSAACLRIASRPPCLPPLLPSDPSQRSRGFRIATLPMDLIGFGYAALVTFGSILGYKRRGGIPSLIGGLFVGFLAGYGAYRVSNDKRDVKLSLFTAFFLATIMGVRYKRSKKIMPAGLVAGLRVTVLKSN